MTIVAAGEAIEAWEERQRIGGREYCVHRPMDLWIIPLTDEGHADLLATVARLVAEEREACAHVIEDKSRDFFFQRSPEMIRAIMAEAIRARAMTGGA